MKCEGPTWGLTEVFELFSFVVAKVSGMPLIFKMTYRVDLLSSSSKGHSLVVSLARTVACVPVGRLLKDGHSVEG